MPKTKISEFSATPGNNTDIDGINIAEGCAPSGINDAIRELMAQLKDFQAGTAGDSFNGPVGTSTAAAGAFTTLSSTGNTTLGDASGDAVTINGATTFVNVSPTITPGTANGVAYLNGSKVLTTGSALTFDGSALTLGGTQRINGTTTSGLLLTSSSGSSNGFKLYNDSTTDIAYLMNFYNGSMVFGVSNSEQMRLTSTGLGIGTSSPATKLDVVGAIRAVTASTAANNLRVGNTGNSLFLGVDSSTGGSNIVGSVAYATTLATNTALQISTNNGASVQATLDSSGNLGLGVTPSAWGSSYKAFEMASAGLMSNTNGGSFFLINNAYYNGTNWIYKYSQLASRYDQSSGIHAWFTAPSGTAGNAISWTQAMTLDASGNLSVGSTSAVGRFTLENSATTTEITLRSTGGVGTNNRARIIAGYEAGGSDYGGYLAFNTTSSSNVNTERARITSGGDLLVGTTSSAQNANTGIKNIASGAVYVVNSGGTDGFSYYNTTAGAYRFYVQNNGTIAATNTTIAAISDQRLKENVRDLDVGLNAIMALKPRKFDWKAGKGKDIKDDRGWIAQEFEQVFPDMIDTWKDEAPEGEEPYKSVRADLIPVLVKAIQEQQALINQLKARLDAANL